MKLIQLQHDACLGMPRGKQLLELPQSALDECNRDGCGCLMTFRMLPRQAGKRHTHNIHACVRLNGLYDGNISFYAIEADSPFAPMILWDIAHTISVGRVLRFYGDDVQQHVLCKEYYQNSFRIVEAGPDCTAFQKAAELPIEKDRGLDSWTFGIPTGPGDAAILNAAVKRILELPCKNKEIILCGRPGENFRYWDQVKIVGEDIAAPPVQISKKKNRIVEHASYANLCILHDRVFLPSDFMDAMRKYGDGYSITTLQSAYFDDYYNLCPFRYSDYHSLPEQEVSMGLSGIDAATCRSGHIRSYAFSPNISMISERFNRFNYQNALRASEKAYATGSLYIVKRTLFRKYPFDEQLCWENFEDVELGLRTNQAGIPHRVNPYALSQSLLGRNLVMPAKGIRYVKANGAEASFLLLRQKALPAKRKPLLKCTEQKAWKNIFTFQKRYCPDLRLAVKRLDAKYRIQAILEMLNSAQFSLEAGAIDKFLDDVEALLLYGSFSHSFRQQLHAQFAAHGGKAICGIIEGEDLKNQLSLRLHGSPFYADMSDYGVDDSVALRIGSFFSACALSMRNKQLFFQPNGLWGYYRAILNSTPLKAYFREA